MVAKNALERFLTIQRTNNNTTMSCTRLNSPKEVGRRHSVLALRLHAMEKEWPETSKITKVHFTNRPTPSAGTNSKTNPPKQIQIRPHPPHLKKLSSKTYPRVLRAAVSFLRPSYKLIPLAFKEIKQLRKYREDLRSSRLKQQIAHDTFLHEPIANGMKAGIEVSVELVKSQKKV